MLHGYGKLKKLKQIGMESLDRKIEGYRMLVLLNNNIKRRRVWFCLYIHHTKLIMKVSIITVCLNSEQTIDQTIQSVVNQNNSDCEYIIIDGKSTDRTLEIIKKYKSKIARVISEPDDGIYDAMNKGIALASGDIIGIINSDDWYEPEIFDIVKNCFQETNAEVVYGKMNLVYANGKSKLLAPTNIEKIRYEMEVPHPTVFIKRDIYEKYGAFQLKYKIAADYDLILRLYTKGVKFVYIDKVLANFRMNGVSNREEERCAEETFLISQNYLGYISLFDRKYFKDLIVHRRQAFYFDKILNDSPYKLYDVLNRKLGIGFDDNIAIFGAGKWGMMVAKALLSQDISSLIFVDNDSKKWSSKNNGVQVFNPEILRTFQGVLLITVNEHSAEILSQIEKMNNSELYCIIWEEIVNELGWDAKVFLT